MAQSSGKAAPGGKGGDIYTQSASALSNASQGTLAAGKAYQGIGGSGGRVAGPAGPSTIASGIGRYMNPYTRDVVDRTSADIARQTQIGVNQVGQNANMQGAFGGARHGLAEGMAAAEGAKTMGDIAAQLRERGFTTAAGLAGEDVDNTQNWRNSVVANNQQNIQNNLAGIGGMMGAAGQGAALAGQGMGIGGQLSGQQTANGAQVQNIVSSLIGQSAGMFDRYTGQPLDSTAAVLGLLAGNPLNAATKTTETNTPGLKSQISGATGLAGKVFGMP